MGQEKTYILGAGASYYSIPVVETFADRFFDFSRFLGNQSKIDEWIIRDFGYGITERFSNASNELNSIYSEFKSHHSFDTYFKKLYHTNKQKEIHRAKKYLNLFFLWEHSVLSIENINPKNNFKKDSLIDKRYDALIAGLLLPFENKSELICKVNFISWNYDLNLLVSLKNYFAPEKTFEDFMDDIKTNSDFEWNIYNQVSVLNMNGFFYSNVLDKLSTLNYRIEAIANKISPEYLSFDYIDKDAEKIKFAWEDKKHFDSITKISKQYIYNSDEITVIGYTFPLYNRLVDAAYIKAGLFNKKFTIQDPRAEVIETNFRDAFGIYENYLQINLTTNCNSFIAPNKVLLDKKI